MLKSSWWFFTNPFEKYARQIGNHLPNFRGENKKCLSVIPRNYLKSSYITKDLESSSAGPSDIAACTSGALVPGGDLSPIGNPYISPKKSWYLWVSYPQESLENTINTVRVHC